MAKEVNCDGILAELGQFGRYQIMNYCLILVPIMFSAVYNSQYVFNASLDPHSDVAMPNKEANCLDKILLELGECGTYQRRTYYFIVLPIMFSAFWKCQYIFNAAKATYRYINSWKNPFTCAVPECESPPYQYETGEWGLWALGADRCARPRPAADAAGACAQGAFHANLTQPCHRHVYETHDSIVAEFDLACQEWKRTLVGTIHSAGLFAALPLTGYVSDTFGRRTAFVLTAVSAALMGLVRSFSVNYAMYLVFEFLDATLGSGVYSTGFILALEMVGLKRRVLGGNIISSSFATGQVILALVAWYVPYWRHLTRVLYVPSFIFILYYFVIEESVRWLLSKGRKQEAARIIHKAAVINKKDLSPETLKYLAEDSSPEVVSGQPLTEEVKKKSLFLQVLKSKILVSRLFICSFWWITVTFIYYGLSINSVSLAGNRYVNFMLTSLVEIPGYALSVLTLDRFGRKSSIMTAFFICGSALVAYPFVPNDMAWIQTCLTMLGKLCISMAFSSIYIYTSELFPTEARHSMLGCCSMFGRIGSIVAPQTPLLMQVMASLPYLIFGIMAGVAGALMLLTPETLRLRLPDTIEQAEAMVVAPHTNKRTDIIVD